MILSGIADRRWQDMETMTDILRAPLLAACSFKLSVSTVSTVLKSMELNRISVCVFVNLNEIAKNKKYLKS